MLSALQRLDKEELPGRLLLVEELNQQQQRELNLKPPSSSQFRIGVARDWPDSRAVWSVWFLPMSLSVPLTCLTGEGLRWWSSSAIIDTTFSLGGLRGNMKYVDKILLSNM